VADLPPGAPSPSARPPGVGARSQPSERNPAAGSGWPSPPPHPLVAEVFAALDEAEVEWSLLRGEASLASPSGDVDLLVSPDDLRTMEAALAGLAVVPLERWGGGVHRTFLGYHAPSDRWIELDVEPELDYGPHASFLVNWMLPSLRTDLARGCLARRRRLGGVWVLDPDDAFWALLLHCIVDKASVAPRHP